MKLYVMVTDAGDGSFHPQFTVDDRLIEILSKAYDAGVIDYETVGVDADGFHYSVVEIPDNTDLKKLGVHLLDSKHFEHLLKFEGEEVDDDC